MRVAFLTYKKRPQLMADDALCVPLLAARGISVEAHPWDEQTTDWSKFDAIVLRSTWDYYLRQGEFLSWIQARENDGARIFNPPHVLRWNTNKSYLRELEAKGVPIVPTRWIDSPEQKLPDFDKIGWQEIVLKPAIGAGGFDATRHLACDTASIQTARSKLAGRYPLLAQPFLKEVLTAGELSFLFLGGAYSHAVVKRPASGNFLVQYDHGGTANEISPAPEWIAAAEKVIQSAPGPLLYARVDMLTQSGKLLLGELEVTEPSLFLDQNPNAPLAFANALANAVSKKN